MAGSKGGKRKTASQKPRQSWGDLNRRSRDRAAREAAQYGLSRRQARERYNRGTYKPFAREPEKRVPESVRKNPEKYPRFLATVDESQLRQDSYEHVRHALTGGMDTIGYNDSVVRANILGVRRADGTVIPPHASLDVVLKMRSASESQLREWAKYQPSKSKSGPQTGTPAWIKNAGWHDGDGRWHSVFWYHG
jgi:hypothetical protein